jgi:hypothetical protein
VMRRVAHAVSVLVASVVLHAACASFGTTATPESDSGTDAATARFCPGGADALFCADFDGAEALEGWDIPVKKLGGTLAGIGDDPTKSRLLEAAIQPVPAGTDSSEAQLLEGVSRLGSRGVSVDVDIDLDEVEAMPETEDVKTVSVAITLAPPRLVTLVFKPGHQGAVVVFPSADPKSTLFHPFKRPVRSGLVHYRLETDFDKGTVSLAIETIPVVSSEASITSAPIEQVLVTSGAVGRPATRVAVRYDNYRVAKL